MDRTAEIPERYASGSKSTLRNAHSPTVKIVDAQTALMGPDRSEKF